MAIGGLFGKVFGGGKSSINELFPSMEMQGSARVLKAIDPTGAQTSRRVSNLAEMEVWAHGKGIKTATNRVDKWVGAISSTETRPVQDILNSVIKENQVNSVLLSACNIERQVVNSPAGTKTIYGLGLGYHNKYNSGMMAKSKIGGAFAWEHAVVVAEGESAKIYTRGEILSQLQRRGMLPEAVEDRSVVGIFKDLQGKTRIGANVLASTEQDILSSSLPIEEVPFIKATIPNKGSAQFEVGGQKFSTFEDAYKVSARNAPSVKVIPKADGAVVNKSVAEKITDEEWADLKEKAAKTTAAREAEERARINAVKEEMDKKQAAKNAGTTTSEDNAFKTKGVSDSPRKGATRSATKTAAQEVIETEQAVGKSFKPGAMKVAGLTAALAAGGLFLSSLLGHKNDTRQDKSTNDNTPNTTIDRGETEKTLNSTTYTRSPQKSPKASTKIRLTDANLNMDEVDSAFAHYFKQGFAYSS